MAIGVVVRRLNIPRQTAAFANKSLVWLASTQQKWMKLKHWRGFHGKNALKAAPVLEFDIQPLQPERQAQRAPEQLP